MVDDSFVTGNGQITPHGDYYCPRDKALPVFDDYQPNRNSRFRVAWNTLNGAGKLATQVKEVDDREPERPRNKALPTAALKSSPYVYRIKTFVLFFVSSNKGGMLSHK